MRYCNNSFHYSILILYVCIICNVSVGYGQIDIPPPVPTNIKTFFWGNVAGGSIFGNRYVPISFDIACDTTEDTTVRYIFDVAEDSAFTQYLPSLQRYLPRFPFDNYCSIPAGSYRQFITDPCKMRGGVRVYGILPSFKPYYLRVRAAANALPANNEWRLRLCFRC